MWFPIFEVLVGRLGDIPKFELHEKQLTYLQFWTSCAFFQIDQKQKNRESFNKVEESPMKLKEILMENARDDPVSYLVVNGIEIIQASIN